jgi:hypothetical protein
MRKFLAPWKDSEGRYGTKKVVTIAYDEESLRLRKGRVRGVATLVQCEGLLVLARDAMLMPERARKVFAGTNRGSLIAFCRLDDYKDCLTMTFQEKRRCYGKYRVAVGGRSFGPDEDDEDGPDEAEDGAEEVPPVVGPAVPGAQAARRNDENVEPFTYNSKPTVLFSELIASYSLMGCYDLSPGDGNAALAFLWERRPYVGICFTDSHKSALMEWLVSQTLRAFGDQSSPFYEPKYQAANSTPAPNAAGATPQKRKAEAPPEPRPRAAAAKTSWGAAGASAGRAGHTGSPPPPCRRRSCAGASSCGQPRGFPPCRQRHGNLKGESITTSRAVESTGFGVRDAIAATQWCIFRAWETLRRCVVGLVGQRAPPGQAVSASTVQPPHDEVPRRNHCHSESFAAVLNPRPPCAKI